jgi:hypothetical protein
LYLVEQSGSFSIPSLSFPRRRESRNVLLKKLDARLRGHDGKNSPTAHLVVKAKMDQWTDIKPLIIVKTENKFK